ncbi:nucleotide exchange factor GrpE [Clostridium thermobutyricum]|uniref:Protein GrpE n=1 Tax=Clostridium thermobutyricum DSM 4928 TaxID=1121339 RepID=A0A1V4SP98_9CLOT|nr:nucleotide exchange factor GrpE [Clostridium thermobutyricum]OPX45295.1 protein GrpE [Clostridium thermobutyricum DSM 4928]
MSKDKEELEKDLNEEIIEESVEENKEEVVEETKEENSEENELSLVKKYKEEIQKLKEELEVEKDKYLRQTAEYQNFKKRTAKEKEGIYTDACVDVLKEILPNLDNIERAIAAEGNIEALKQGVEMTLKGFQNSLEKLGVTEIETSEGFDPNFHNAIMHIEDPELGTNVVVEVFMKGYKRGDKVIRHSMVKTAN